MGLKTLLNRLKKTASINIVRHISQLLIGIIISRQLGVEDKGLHFVFTSIAAAVAILGSYGLINSIVFHAKKKYIDLAQVYIYVVLSLSILSLTCGLLYIVGHEILHNMLFGSEKVQVTVLWLFAAYIFSSLLNYFVNSFCLAFGRMSLYLFAFGFSSLFGLLLITLGATFFTFDIVDCLKVIVFTELVCGLFAFGIICKSKNENYVKEPKGLPEVLDYALKGYLGVSGSTIISHGDSFVLSNVFSKDLLGLYSIAKTLYRLFAIVPQTVNSAIFGVLCELQFSKASTLVKKVCLGMGAVFTFVILISVFVLESFIVLIWGESFSDAFLPAFILLFAAMLMASTAPINPLLLTQNKPFWSSKITIVSGFAGLITCVFLSIYFGLIGAAISVFISASITSVMRLFYFKKIQDLN